MLECFKLNRFFATLGLALVATCGSLPALAQSHQPRTVKDGVYTDAQADLGRQLYQKQCAECHGNALAGGIAPPLAGNSFLTAWRSQTLWQVATKIHNTMPQDDPGKLTPPQVTELLAYMLQGGKFPSGRTELGTDEAALSAIALPGAPAQSAAAAASHIPSFPPVGNMAQLMRGILFPSSNIIFNVQTNDPSAAVNSKQPGAGASTTFSWTDWGAGIYKPWDIVDYAAIAVAEAAPLLLTPGRRCENGKLAPVDRPDWIKFTQEMAEAGRAAYKASQTRNQEVVSDVTNQLSDSCLHCHEVYRDKPGGTKADPSNRVARCTP